MTDPTPTSTSGIRSYLFERHRHNWILLAKFSIVGGSGFIVNLAVFWLVFLVWGDEQRLLINLPFTEFNVRAYHLYSTLAFIVANASNYLLNRLWTFESHGETDWRREYVPFLVIGIVAQALGLLILTLLLHPNSPVRVDNPVLAQAITIVVVTPISFVGNKLWTFGAVRPSRRTLPVGDARGSDDAEAG